MRIITRAEWGAKPPKYRNSIRTPTPRLWVHHTADDRQGPTAVRAHQTFHMNTKGWSDIAYSFLIGDNGEIFEGRGFRIAGGHTKDDNTRSHGICLLGNFDRRKPTNASLRSLIELATYGRNTGYWIPTLGGHKDAPGAATACPGRHLYAVLPAIRNRVAHPPPVPLPKAKKGWKPAYRPYPGSISPASLSRNIKVWQQLLNERGSHLGNPNWNQLAVDGGYGPKTNHVIEFAKKLYGVNERYAGPKLWHQLLFR